MTEVLHSSEVTEAVRGLNCQFRERLDAERRHKEVLDSIRAVRFTLCLILLLGVPLAILYTVVAVASLDRHSSERKSISKPDDGPPIVYELSANPPPVGRAKNPGIPPASIESPPGVAPATNPARGGPILPNGGKDNIKPGEFPPPLGMAPAPSTPPPLGSMPAVPPPLDPQKKGCER